ncbi:MULTISPECIES: ABC transporter ATP-binding protein [Mesorhizobium]|uniref:ABC transporter ATP-binding protein n=1 Tax=Mesorhizobium TaxID=68287 RepID=UPI0003CF3977|nr:MULTISPECIES: ABC transporter ATP-binding protein [Mesorhizobium]ESY62221.1 spermidine/putrescine ABC transporter ATP-binding protein [Mesorhizobium sp. LNHC232B00]WJI38852.1 ABC transporter ATP-binding protein [Mesorhizobium opportunistum]
MSSQFDPFLQFIDVQKAYDSTTMVVKSLNLNVANGEFLTLLGPSGSGKTTTLMMLAGFEEPTSGEIRLQGRSMNGIPPHKRGVGMVFQNYSLFPHMTVGENLAFPLQARGMNKAEQTTRIRTALDMVKLGSFADRRPGQLSGGQQQRVALARALVFEPELVLMDEPLGALDKQLRDHMQLEIKHLHDRIRVTVVYVTHDQTEALVMSDRIAVFNEGRIQQIAPPAEIYQNPETDFVAQFIGENNRIEATVKQASGNQCQLVLKDGANVLANSPRKAEAGEARVLSVRPEMIVVGPDAHDLANSYESKVREIVYLGDHVRVILRFGGIDDLSIKLTHRRAANLSIGDPVRFGWKPEDCRAL